MLKNLKLKNAQKIVEEERRKLAKRNNGITLIALVITIIVLLILAGISIAMLTGENGILTRANDAKNKTEEAEQEERNNLNTLNSLIEDFVNETNESEGTDMELLLEQKEQEERLILGVSVSNITRRNCRKLQNIFQ